MATYDNQYSMKITPATPNLRGLTTNYDNTGKTNLGGTGLGDLYELDYDRNKIESIFNEGTDAQYALMQKENQIAQNQYANNQFANQQSALNTLRAQRNEQIASGMARGLNAAQEQGTVLGLQQESAAGALELANQQQLEADKIAAEYASNVSKALQEANSVKQAMAQVAAQMYEADMLGYTGELSALAQMDANASDRYGYDKGYEGTVYNADMGYKGTVYNANKNYEGTELAAKLGLEGTKYAADKNYDAAKLQADATKAAAITTANAYRRSGGGGGTGNTTSDANFIEYCYKKGKNKEGMIAALQASGTYTKEQATTIANQYFKNTTKYLAGSDGTLYFDESDGLIKPTQNVSNKNIPSHRSVTPSTSSLQDIANRLNLGKR